MVTKITVYSNGSQTENTKTCYFFILSECIGTFLVSLISVLKCFLKYYIANNVCSSYIKLNTKFTANPSCRSQDKRYKIWADPQTLVIQMSSQHAELVI